MFELRNSEDVKSSLGDGDSKTFKGILTLDPYQGQPDVIKKECVGHVQKRMGS
ncbi:GSCOCG00005820001-RA-CDS, partial [Cotesia congregata]